MVLGANAGAAFEPKAIPPLDTVLCVFDCTACSGQALVEEQLRLLVDTFTCLAGSGKENRGETETTGSSVGDPSAVVSPAMPTSPRAVPDGNGNASLSSRVLSRHRAAAAAAEAVAAAAAVKAPPVCTEIVFAIEAVRAGAGAGAGAGAAGPKQPQGWADFNALQFLIPLLEGKGMEHTVVPHASMHPSFQAPEIFILRIHKAT